MISRVLGVKICEKWPKNSSEVTYDIFQNSHTFGNNAHDHTFEEARRRHMVRIRLSGFDCLLEYFVSRSYNNGEEK